MKPKTTKFNRRRVYRGWLGVDYPDCIEPLSALKRQFSEKLISANDLPCRITVEWVEKGTK